MPVTPARASGYVRPGEAGRQRYRAAERELWKHHGLAAEKRHVQLEFPRVRLRVTAVGSGRPVLLVGGLAGAGPLWAGLIAELQGLRCLVLDRPGCGLSTPIDHAAHDPAAVVTEILAGLLDRLGIRRCPVVGQGIGNLWALRFALRDPSRVDRVVLLGGGPVVAGVRPPLLHRVLATPLGALMVASPAGRAMLLAGLGPPGRDGGGADGCPSMAERDWRTSLARDTPTMRHDRTMLRSVVGPGGLRPGVVLREDELVRIGAPTLLVHGGAGRTGALDRWREVVALLPEGELCPLPAAGDVPWLDEPAVVGRYVRRFLLR